jgi:hypothetical protein
MYRYHPKHYYFLVKNATAGDFVKIAGDVYLIIKTSPTVSADLVSTADSGVNSYIDLENRPDDVIDTTVVPATTTGEG